MTLHVSLPKELETLVHHEVQRGMYSSASEVVRDALRKFFDESDTIRPEELAWLRDEMQERKRRALSGEDVLIDGETFFAQMDTSYGLDG